MYQSLKGSKRNLFSPYHSFTAAELIDQECQHGGLLRRTVGLKSFSPEAEGQRSWLRLLTMGLHVDLQDLWHIVSVDLHISQVFPQGGFALKQKNVKGGVNKFKKNVYSPTNPQKN